ncbi:MAG: hypothetical protein WCP53_06795 [Verrucomicrobiota bacterium]
MALVLMRRFRRPAEVAAAVWFLAGAEGGDIPGAVLKIDGGILWPPGRERSESADTRAGAGSRLL